MNISETYIVNQVNQNLFILSYTPIDETQVSMVVADGGVELVNGRDFTVQGKDVSYTMPNPSFDIGESIVFKYFY